jgi:uncharacterized membrane protein YdjX (TVP38/TMEM64 family)
MAATEAPATAPPRRWFSPRLLVLVVLVAAIAAYYLTRPHPELSWDNVRARVEGSKAWVADHLLVSGIVYFGVYFLVAALSLPIAAMVTLVGGALFGVWIGTALVSAASTLGATAAMLLSRYLFGDWVQRRWGGRLAALNRGVELDGAYYLLSLRLVVVIPFWLLNLGMGLTKLPVRTYVWVSWVGMLPATVMYVYFGQELSRISSPGDVLSAEVLIALALLGVVPLVLRFLFRPERPAPTNH